MLVHNAGSHKTFALTPNVSAKLMAKDCQNQLSTNQNKATIRFPTQHNLTLHIPYILGRHQCHVLVRTWRQLRITERF